MKLAGAEPNLISWNALIAGFGQVGLVDEALNSFHQMQLVGLKPDWTTVASVLQSSAHSAILNQGKEIHGYIIKSGLESDAIVSSALVDMYSKCGVVEDARGVFNRVSQGDVVLWTAMIVGYAHNECIDKALELFREMQLVGVQPNSITIPTVVSATAYLATPQKGKETHCYIIKSGLESDIAVGSALVAMYAKCGSIENACQVFGKISQRNVFLWNAMISGYAMHGHGEDALTHFYLMQQECVNPDHITFTAVLSACSHAGMVDEGWKHFYGMVRDYHITPCVEHYACMVDLLGRAGCLDEAHDFINEMPLEPTASVWGALLGACRIYGNPDLGKCVAKCLFELEPENTGNYVLLSNICAAAGRWEDVANVRKMMKDKGLKNRPGCSWIEVSNRVHTFTAGDRSHPQTEKIYVMLQSLTEPMEEAGYLPDKNFILYDMEEEDD